MNVRIVLADDHPIMLEGLKALLEREAGVKVVGLATTGREAVSLAQKLSPDLVIMDVSMPELNGIEATRQIISHNPKVNVIALTIHNDARYAVEMIKAGARGYVPKQRAYEELSRAVRSVEKGEAFLSPGVAGNLLETITGKDGGSKVTSFASLTSREREIMQLLAEGNTSRAIAAKLNISIKTVDTHKVNVMRKLGLKSLAELVRHAIREGICTA